MVGDLFKLEAVREVDRSVNLKLLCSLFHIPCALPSLASLYHGCQMTFERMQSEELIAIWQMEENYITKTNRPRSIPRASIKNPSSRAKNGHVA